MRIGTRATIALTVLTAILLLSASPLGALVYRNLRSSDDMLVGWQDYRALTFEAARTSGAPILVEVYASWCPVCMAQHRAFQHLQEEGDVPAMSVFRVDYDRDTDFREGYDVAYTGTLIIFKDGKEVARSIGLTEAAELRGFINAHMGQTMQAKS